MKFSLYPDFKLVRHFCNMWKFCSYFILPFKHLLDPFTKRSKKRRRELEEESERTSKRKKMEDDNNGESGRETRTVSKPSLPKRKRSDQQTDQSITGGGRSEYTKRIKLEQPSSSSSTSQTVPVPLTADKFTYHHVLGQGGFGKVMLATDAKRKEQVAVKILSKSSQSWFHFAEKSVLKLSGDCPFLIHGYGAFQTPSSMFYVMELATGGNLYDYLNNTPEITMEAIMFLAAEMVCGLQFLHLKGIIHRDIKPQNILLSQEGHVKITDFGLAAYHIFKGRPVTARCGNTGFMAPEVIERRPYNAGVDWFAFGVTLYWMLTNTAAFPGKNRESIHRAVIEDEPSYAGLDHKTTDLLQRLLWKDDSVRLGVNGDIRKHKFFKYINWTKLETGKVKSPVTLPAGDLSDLLSKQVSLSSIDDFSSDIKEDRFKKICFVTSSWAKDYVTTTAYSDVLPPDVAQHNVDH